MATQRYCNICDNNVDSANYDRHKISCQKFHKYKNIILKRYKKGESTKALANEYSLPERKLKPYFISLGVYRDRKASRKLAGKLHPLKHTKETKRKISNIRKAYLEKHPEKVPYLLNHASKMSFPEKRFYRVLKNIGCTGWEYNYQHGRYSYDFAFTKLKLDVEIDGGTHILPNVKKNDIERDSWSIDRGWKVLRFTASECARNLPKCIDFLLDTIKLIDPNYNFKNIHNKWEKLKPKLTILVACK